MKRIKRLLIYGDSISTGTHGDGGYEPGLLKAFEPDMLANFSVGESGLSPQTPGGMLKILKEQEQTDHAASQDADLILVWHGTNDWYWGTPLGALGDKTEDTFYGCIHQAIGRLRKRNPEALILWGTPLYRWGMPNGGRQPGSADELKNKAGVTLLDYQKVLCDSAEQEGFSLIPIGQLTKISEKNAEQFLEDRVHPNRAGYERIEQVWIQQIRDRWEGRAYS